MKLFGFNNPKQSLDNTTSKAYHQPKTDEQHEKKILPSADTAETKEFYNPDLEDENRINANDRKYKTDENVVDVSTIDENLLEAEADADNIDDLIAKYAKIGIVTDGDLESLAKKCSDYLNEELDAKPLPDMEDIRELALFYVEQHEEAESPFDDSEYLFPLTKKEMNFLSDEDKQELIDLENEWRDLPAMASRRDRNDVTYPMNDILKSVRRKAAEAAKAEKKNEAKKLVKKSEKEKAETEESGSLQSDKRFEKGPNYIKLEADLGRDCINFIFNKKDRPVDAGGVPLDNFAIEEAAVDYAEFMASEGLGDWDKGKLERLKKSAENMNKYNDKELKLMENSANYLVTKKNRPFFENGDVMTDEQIQEVANEYAEIKVEKGEWGKGKFSATSYKGDAQLESKVFLPGGKSMKYVFSHESPEGTYYFKVVSGVRANKKDPKRLTAFVDLKFEAKNPKEMEKAGEKPERLKLVKKSEKIEEKK